MLTVQRLVEDIGLELLTGEEAAEAPVRWVHITELLDPTPWLSGGELLLTTGIQLDTRRAAARVRRRLSRPPPRRARLRHRVRPRAAAARRSLSEAEALGFPVFEVPYELPFIAITEKAFTRLVNEQYEVLQRGIAIHKRLERLVLEERGLDEVVRALAAAIGGAVLRARRARGEPIAAEAFRRELPTDALERRAPRGGRRSAAPGTGSGRRERSPPTTPSSPAARSRCRWRRRGARRPAGLARGGRATRAASATSSA